MDVGRRLSWVSVATGVAFLWASGANAQICGDADGSGAITVSDGVTVLRAAADLSNSCSGRICDVDGNGSISVSDGVAALRRAAQLPAGVSCGTRFGDLVKTVRIGPDVANLNVGTPPGSGPNAPQDVLAIDGLTKIPGNTETTLHVQLARSVDSLVVAFQEGDAFVDGFAELPVGGASGTVELILATGNPSDEVSVDLNVTSRGGNQLGAYQTKPLTITPALQCGATVQATLSIPTEVDTYQFAAGGGEVVAITTGLVSGAATPCWQLFDRNGQSVGDRLCRTQAERILPSGGSPFTIVVSDDDFLNAGTYSVSLAPVSATFDGQASCATAIACGETKVGTLQSTGSADTYQFAADGGELVAITTGLVSGAASPCWELFDRNGQPVEGRVCRTQAERILPSGGSPFTIVVSDDDFLNAGTYSVSLAPVSATFDGQASCATAIACGETKVGTLESTGTADTYQFAAEGDEVVAITTGLVNGAASPCWELFDRDGQPVGDRLCRTQAERILPSGGSPFTIVVSDDDFLNAGSYSVSLAPVSATFDGQASCATAIACGETKVGTLESTGTADTYQFVGGGEVVAITTGVVSGAANPCWELFDRDGQPVGDRLCRTQAERTLPSGGSPFTIVVSDDDFLNAGDYSLTRSCSP